MDFEQADTLNSAIRSIGIRHRALAGALLAPSGIHPGQEVLLLELDTSGPRTQGQLAIACGCEPPTITGSVRKLEAAGLVVRRPSPTDGRVTIVELSDNGHALMPGLKAAWHRLAEHTVAGLSTRSIESVIETLVDLARSITMISIAAGDPVPPPTGRTFSPGPPAGG